MNILQTWRFVSFLHNSLACFAKTQVMAVEKFTHKIVWLGKTPKDLKRLTYLWVRFLILTLRVTASPNFLHLRAHLYMLSEAPKMSYRYLNVSWIASNSFNICHTLILARIVSLPIGTYNQSHTRAKFKIIRFGGMDRTNGSRFR